MGGAARPVRDRAAAQPHALRVPDDGGHGLDLRRAARGAAAPGVRARGGLRAGHGLDVQRARRHRRPDRRAVRRRAPEPGRPGRHRAAAGRALALDVRPLPAPGPGLAARPARRRGRDQRRGRVRLRADGGRDRGAVRGPAHRHPARDRGGPRRPVVRLPLLLHPLARARRPVPGAGHVLEPDPAPAALRRVDDLGRARLRRGPALARPVLRPERLRPAARRLGAARGPGRGRGVPRLRRAQRLGARRVPALQVGSGPSIRPRSTRRWRPAGR